MPQIEYLLTVANVMLLDKKTKAQLATATLKTNSMSQSVTSSEIRAGQFNSVLTTINSDKTIAYTIEDVCQKREFIAMMLGSSITKEASVEAYVLPQVMVVGAEGKVTLPETPLNTAEVKFSRAEGESVTATVSGKEATLTGASEGDEVYVSGYAYTTSADTIVMSTDKFAGEYILVLDELIFGQDMSIIGRKQTILNNVTPDQNFTLDASSEIAEGTTSYTFTAKASVGSTEIGKILYLPYVEA